MELPEQLVKEHDKAIRGNRSIQQTAEAATAITLSHIGAALEWALGNGFIKHYNEDRYSAYGYNPCTLSDLITKYFESLK